MTNPSSTAVWGWGLLRLKVVLGAAGVSEVPQRHHNVRGWGWEKTGLRMAVWTAGFFLLSSQIPSSSNVFVLLQFPHLSSPPSLYQDLLVQPRILPFTQLGLRSQPCLSACKVLRIHSAFSILSTSAPYTTLRVVGLPKVSRNELAGRRKAASGGSL